MTTERFNEIQTASIFIISGLFLCLMWWFIPGSIMYTFPFIDITFPLRDFITLFTESLTGLYLLPSALIAGNMSFPINIPYVKYKSYNIWYGIILFEILKQIDLILNYRQTHFRFYTILFLMGIQIYYLYQSSKKMI